MLLVTFGTIENYHIEYLLFIIAAFNTAYHSILSRPALANLMAVLHYVYMIMRTPAPNRAIMVLGNVHTVYHCERENLQIAANLELLARMEVVLTASKKMAPEELESQTKKLTMKAIKAKMHQTKKVSLGLEDPSRAATIRANIDLK